MSELDQIQDSLARLRLMAGNAQCSRFDESRSHLTLVIASTYAGTGRHSLQCRAQYFDGTKRDEDCSREQLTKMRLRIV